MTPRFETRLRPTLALARRLTLGLALVLTLVLTGASAVGAAALLTPIAELPPRDDLAAFVLREQAVTVDLALLGDPDAGIEGAESFTVDLFGETVVAFKERVERNPSGSLTWIGGVTGDLAGRIVLVARGGIVQGSVRALGRTFEIKRVNARYQVLQEIDTGSPLLREFEPTEVAPAAGGASRDPGATGDDGSVIDILVVYTAAAMASAGGTPDDIEARIELGVAETNLSYANSGIDPLIRLVRIEAVTYVESGSISTDRNRLRINGDGFLDEVHPWRDTYGADIVHMISLASGGCGIAYIMTTVDPSFEEFAFCVTSEPCISPNYTFPHEMGHLQSARHDYDADPTNNSPFTFNHGYNDQLTSVWRTVMSYNNCPGSPCTRSLYWSNPDVIHPVTGTAMGIPEGQPQAADNHLTLNTTAFTVANFRPSVGAIFTDGFESGDTSAWSATIP